MGAGGAAAAARARRRGFGRPLKHPRREIVNAILYQARTGCSWRLLARGPAAVGHGLRLLLAGVVAPAIRADGVRALDRLGVHTSARSVSVAAVLLEGGPPGSAPVTRDDSKKIWPPQGVLYR